jgi:peptidoglycan/LPS O-acetylase OafA/YrhL
MTQQEKPAQLLHLTSLRFFAALAVLTSHLYFLRSVDNPIKPIADTFFHEGYFGVSFFFMLSGFILSHTYQDRLVQRRISSKQYLLLRLSKIVPLHLITAFICWHLLLFWNQKTEFSVIVVNILLLHSWIPDAKWYFSLNAVSWSLSVELFFYTTFIVLARCSTRSLQKVAIIWFLVISAIATAMIICDNGNLGTDNGELKLSHWFFYIHPVVRLLDFLVGILIYRLSFVKKPVRYASFNELCSMFLLLSGMYVFSTFKLPDLLRVQLLYLPIITYVIYSFSDGTGIVSKRLKGKFFVLLGEASFSLYMIHKTIIDNAYAIYQRLALSMSLVVFSVLLTLFCITASVVTYKVVEKPLHTYLRAKIKTLC